MSKVKKTVRTVGIRNAKMPKRVEKPGTFEVRQLDPVRKCGPGTSVQLLLRVIERADGRATNHLVFFDRHGWYCEHGRTCHAVAFARKEKGRLVRAVRR